MMITMKEKIIDAFISSNKPIMKKTKLIERLDLQKDEIRQFESDLKFLIHNRIILTTKEKKLRYNIGKDIIIGKIYFAPNGFAFVNPSGQNGKNFYVSKNNALNSLHEDKVIAIKTKDSNKAERRRPEAKVICVLERTIDKVVGTYMDSEKFGFVIPDDNRYNRDIYIPVGKSKDAKSYDKVSVKIEKYPKGSNRRPEGIVLDVLGIKGEKEAENKSVVEANGIRSKFPASVLKESNLINLNISEDEISRRTDFRNEIIYTIDGVDAKDLDDAVSVKKLENGNYELGVYIADVAHYVKENSAIDKEALERGTSVYLINEVVPMLPKVLSNNVCSLNEDGDKLVLCIVMTIDSNGTCLKSEVSEGIIRSKGRLNYKEVTAFLEGSNPEFEKNRPEVAKSLILGEELAQILRTKRENRGSIDFGFKETKIQLDEENNTLSVEAYERGVSNKLIEEFMLMANETVAEKFNQLNLPFIYRVHTYPRVEKLQWFAKIMQSYGYDMEIEDFEDIQPKELQTFLSSIDEDCEALKMLLLQAMQQARYNEYQNIHFGLSADYYSHFTSPIRRYPDLMIHRIIKLHLSGVLKSNAMKEKYEKIVSKVAKHCSKTERIAEKAERELDKVKMNEYIMSNRDKTFEGFVRNFNHSGIFVMLENTVDGFIRIKDFNFDEDSYKGFIGNKEFKLGTKLTVKPKMVNVNSKEILFEIV